MYYNLESSQADRINFDEMVERYARAMVGTLSDSEARGVDMDEYIALAWDNFDADVVDDIAEARARFFPTFRDEVASIIFEAHGAEFSFFRDLPAPRGERGGWVWCLSGEKGGLLWETDNYEADNRVEAQAAAIDYLQAL